MLNEKSILSLDCQSFESTLLSVSKITKIDLNLIVEILSALPADKFYSIDDIWNKLILHSYISDFSYDRIYWFHGSRTNDHMRFWKKGILPLNTIKVELIDFLEFLNSKIDKNHSEPIKNIDTGKQLGTKLIYQKGGPYAFMIKDMFFEKDSINHDYLKLPEIISDIIYSRMEFKKNANKLVELYENATKSCIVKFFNDDTDEFYLKKACLYLFFKIHNIGLPENASPCFVGKGEIVLSENITDIEIIRLD